MRISDWSSDVCSSDLSTASLALGGDCYSYALLSSGHVDLVVESGLKLYDFAALVPVVEGAGGRMTDWTGAPLGGDSDGRVIAAGDPALVDQEIGRASCRERGCPYV